MTQMKKIIVALFAALFLATTVFADSLEKYADKPLVLTIVETSDTHGAIFPYDFKTDKPKDTSLANVVTLVNELRAKKDGELLLLDGGDNLQGQPLIYYYNFVATGEQSVLSAAMNRIGYDAIALGNHDIETGHDVFDKVNKELKKGPEKAGFVCANLVNEKTRKPYFTPYVVVKKGGLKIAILGLTEPAFVKNFPKVLYSGIAVEDMVESAKKWIPVIQSKEKPDLILGLFHSGVDYTYGGATSETSFNENAAQIVANKVPGFDAVFVGHDHAGWDGTGYDPATKSKIDVKDVNGKNVPIYGALNDARKIPVVTMTLTWNKETKKLDISQRAVLQDMTAYKPDEAFVAAFSKQIADAKAWVSKPIGKMNGSITSRDSMFGDSAFVDLIHGLQLELSKDPAYGLKPAQISFCAPLSANAVIPSSSDGTIYVRDMFSLYVYENWLYTMDLTGQQVKDFLEASYDGWLNQMASKEDHLIAFAKGSDGNLVIDARTNMPKTRTPSYNYDSAAGIVYDVDVSKPYGSRIAVKSMADGSAFDLSKTYSVAINSYRAMGGGGMLEKGAKIPAADLLSMKYVTSATTKDLRFYLTKYIESRKQALEPKPFGTWSIIPQDWAASGKTLDYPLLYPAAK